MKFSKFMSVLTANEKATDNVQSKPKFDWEFCVSLCGSKSKSQEKDILCQEDVSSR